MLGLIRCLSLAWLLSAGAALCFDPNERYQTSVDGDTEAIYVSKDKALFQLRLPPDEGTRELRYYLCFARPGDEPEVAEGIGVEMRQGLIGNVSDGCWVETKAGKKMLLIGDAYPENRVLPVDEHRKFYAANQGLYWLVDGKRVMKANTLKELAVLAPELQPVLSKVKFMKITEFFNQMKSEIIKTAQSKKSSP